jgi:UDP-N-acetyl-D-mannosaminuronate dehydrogenase
VVDRVNDGIVPFPEANLPERLRAALDSKSLRAQTEPTAAHACAIAVPTPTTAERRADLRYVQAAAESIVPHLRPGALVVLESTVPLGTTDRVREHDPRVLPSRSRQDTVRGADCVVLLVDHAESASLDPDEIGGLMRCRRVFGTRHLVDPDRWRRGGFEVRRLGVG